MVPLMKGDAANAHPSQESAYSLMKRIFLGEQGLYTEGEILKLARIFAMDTMGKDDPTYQILPSNNLNEYKWRKK